MLSKLSHNRRALGAGRVLRLARDVCSARLMGAVRARIAPIYWLTATKKVNNQLNILL